MKAKRTTARVPNVLVRVGLIVSVLAVAVILMLAVQNTTLVSAQQDKSQDKQGKATSQISLELADALDAKAANLEKREADILRKEQELAVLETDLIRRLQDVAREKEALDAEKARIQLEEAQRTDARVLHIANTLKNTKAGVAASQLEALYAQNRETALFVLNQLDARSAGKIFSKIKDPKLYALIQEDFKQWRIGQKSAGATIKF